MKKLTDLELEGKKALVRVDFNVPLGKESHIADDSRIRAALPTIQYLIDKGASIILMSHLGRPTSLDPALSLAPIAKHLSQLLGKHIFFAPDCTSSTTQKMAQELDPGEILLLENLRFYPEEEEPEKNPSFVSSLASLGDVYINDAFGTAHRAHASTAMVAKAFSDKAAGFLMQKELDALTPLLNDPPKPFHAIVGGAKISTKTGVIHRLLKMVDALYVGGAMAIPFFNAMGIKTGDTKVEDADVVAAREVLEKATLLYLPKDVVISDTKRKKVIRIEQGVPRGYQIMDIGPETIVEFSKHLSQAKTVFWNGPLGAFEDSAFARGTRKVAEVLASIDGKVIVGGGDSIAAISKIGLKNAFAHLSTGGGASLELLEYGHLPGVDALSNS